MAQDNFFLPVWGRDAKRKVGHPGQRTSLVGGGCSGHESESGHLPWRLGIQLGVVTKGGIAGGVSLGTLGKMLSFFSGLSFLISKIKRLKNFSSPNVARTACVKKTFIFSIIFFLKIETNTEKKLKCLLLHEPRECSTSFNTVGLEFQRTRLKVLVLIVGRGAGQAGGEEASCG